MFENKLTQGEKQTTEEMQEKLRRYNRKMKRIFIILSEKFRNEYMELEYRDRLV